MHIYIHQKLIGGEYAQYRHFLFLFFSFLFFKKTRIRLKTTMKKISILFVTVFFLFSFALDTSAEKSIFLKSDSSWKAHETLEENWFSSDFVDAHWDFSSGNWKNNPCAYYCGSLKSCELSCLYWMWHSSSCSNCSKYFRKEILIPEEVTYGRISIAADDFYWLYVNGNFVGADYRDIGYQNYETYDITTYLRSGGKNVIAIKAHNKENYEGVFVSGEIRYKDVSEIKDLESKIEILDSQINALTQDKKRLEIQVDALQSQLNALLSEKEELNKQLNALNLGSIKFERGREDLETKILQQRILCGIMLLALVSICLFCYFLYKENKKLKEKRKPTLTKVPLERTTKGGETRV